MDSKRQECLTPAERAAELTAVESYLEHRAVIHGQVRRTLMHDAGVALEAEFDRLAARDKR